MPSQYGFPNDDDYLRGRELRDAFIVEWVNRNEQLLRNILYDWLNTIKIVPIGRGFRRADVPPNLIWDKEGNLRKWLVTAKSSNGRQFSGRIRQITDKLACVVTLRVNYDDIGVKDVGLVIYFGCDDFPGEPDRRAAEKVFERHLGLEVHIFEGGVYWGEVPTRLGAEGGYLEDIWK